MAELWTTARAAPAAFMHWWLGELAGLLPRWLRAASGQARACLILVLGHDRRILVERTPRRGETELGRIAGSGPHDDRPLPALARLGARRYRKWPIVVRLGGELGLRKVVDLPLGARDDLGELLRFELDRLTPFKAEDMCFAWRVLTADPSSGRMQVELEMAPKAVVDRGLDLVAGQGRQVDRIELEGDLGREPLNLLPRAAEPPAGSAWPRRLLPLAVLGLAAVAVIIPLRKQQALIEALEAEIAVVRAEAEEGLAIRRQLDALEERARFLASVRNGRATMTDVLAELTRLIPDDSHILQLQIQGATVELSGLADKASDLIAILDRSPMLASPQFRSPVTRDQRSDKERFQIAVDLVGRPS